ncbi:hypothetical protein TNCT_7691 [Trichonephila clavata]|uniref:Uncharacterized protein n=1 Tax=Trichonephila clavata TaxID=2740835 RepID=A0A8X6HTF7_TRICU|nr:hypothetical protein TNCT_7691 [Trichonephila clavata]
MSGKFFMPSSARIRFLRERSTCWASGSRLATDTDTTRKIARADKAERIAPERRLHARLDCSRKVELEFGVGWRKVCWRSSPTSWQCLGDESMSFRDPKTLLRTGPESDRWN